MTLWYRGQLPAEGLEGSRTAYLTAIFSTANSLAIDLVIGVAAGVWKSDLYMVDFRRERFCVVERYLDGLRLHNLWASVDGGETEAAENGTSIVSLNDLTKVNRRKG